jgi:hypothetical protein
VILLLDPLPFITEEEAMGITKKKAGKSKMVVAPVREQKDSARARDLQSLRVTQHRQTQGWVAEQLSPRNPPSFPGLKITSPAAASSLTTEPSVPSPRLLDVPSGKQSVLINAKEEVHLEAFILCDQV